MKKSYHLFFISCFLLCCFSCNSNGQETTTTNTEKKTPSRRDLAEKFWSAKKILLIYPSQDSTKNNYQNIAERIKTSAGDRINFELKPDAETTETEFIENVTVLIGTPNSNKFIQNIHSELPFKIEKNVLHFENQQFENPNSIFTLPFYINPKNTALPMTLITGLEDAVIINHLEKVYEEGRQIFGWSSWGYEIYQNHQRLIFGNFNSKTWEVDKKVHFDFSNSLDSMPSSAHFNFVKRTEINDIQAIELAKKCEQKAQQIRNFIGSQKEISKIDFCLYRSAEEKGLVIRNAEQANANFSNNSVHVVLNETYSNNFIGKENELLLRHLLGEPKTKTLERGLAIFFTENWQRKGYQYWANKLFSSGNVAPLSELLNEDLQHRNSRYVLGCLAGSFVEFLIQNNGKEHFLTHYLNWQPSEKEIQKLEKEWHQYLSKQSKNILFDNMNLKIPYLKGFNFAHEGYQIYNGYISREAKLALERLKTISTNSVAIVPYSYMRDPRKPTYIPIINDAGAENDESVVHSATMAKKMGMTAVLKPQIWIGRNSWPGDVEMKNEADWQQWFDNYYRWIRHYAILAEIHEIEVFVIGTEFAKATLQREKDWRNLIQKIRKLYSGKLTYAANWGDEFEKIAFWDEFDFIGLNCYYPLSKNENASEKELRNGFKNTIAKIEGIQKKIKKPLVFTEIGFRSIQSPWTEPHAEPNRPFNGEHQKLCYEIVFEAIENKDWCKGILWWKYPSYLNHRRAENSGFTPHEKPAEEVVKKWFGKMPN